MRTQLRASMLGVMALALVVGTVAQTPAKDMGSAPGILPSGLRDAIDRDIVTIRNTTVQFKTTDARPLDTSA